MQAPMSQPLQAPNSIDSKTTYERPRRLLAIDLLRGLTICFMIMVNDNGSDAAYWFMKHAEWNGFTPTDLVFPTFLLLVGVSTVLSTAKRLEQGASKLSLWGHVVRRSVILFLLGMVVNNFPFFHPATLRFYGVLPRIALCYLVVGTFYIFNSNWKNKVAALVGVLVAYWILMRFVPVPGFGIPGKDVPLLDPNNNLAAWLDRQIFSSNHLYEGTRDPEGLLSTIPALGTMLIGILAGLWLRTTRPLAEKIRGIAIAGVSGLILGGLWNFQFPINKKLWTSSYVLFAAGWSLLLMAFFLWFADHRAASADPAKPQRKSVFAFILLVFGTNAIAAYELSEVGASSIGFIHPHPGIGLGQWTYQGLLWAVTNASFASFLYSLSYAAVCWIIVYLALYRWKIFLKI
jgi:predicted acyltransferase